MCGSFSYWAPGSAMVMGEHAVLRGYPAIVAALDAFITVTVTLRNDNTIFLSSKDFGTYETRMTELFIEKPWHFVLYCVSRMQGQLKKGLNITIESTMSHEQGLGSSAAVTVATLGALWKALGIECHKESLFIAARDIIRTVQGLGSGTDVAASVYGGVLYYHAAPLRIVALGETLPFYLVYSGNKVPTVEVVRQVNAKEAAASDGLIHLWNAMGDCTERARNAIEEKNWPELGILCNEYQKYMMALGVSNASLDKLWEDLRAQPGVWGAKISGSGLGDSVLVVRE